MIKVGNILNRKINTFLTVILIIVEFSIEKKYITIIITTLL
jgi:hypothetical protein